jgi:copper chaperone CopZ
MITRKSFFIVASLLFFISFISFSQKHTMKIKIDGMHCAAGCAMYIQNELNNMEGVVEANINFNESVGDIILKKRTKETEVLAFVNDLKGGAYQASILKAEIKSCSKGKSCCQKTGKKIADCDKKSSGCCTGSSGKKECSKKKK